MLVMRQDHGRRDSHAELTRQRVIEKLVVGGPPEWIVDDDRASKRSILEKSAVERDILRDAVDDHAISTGIRHLDAAHLDELGGHAINPHAVDLLHQRGWEGVFHAKDDSNFVHMRLTLPTVILFSTVILSG